jgi:hypothetical protein
MPVLPHGDDRAGLPIESRHHPGGDDRTARPGTQVRGGEHPRRVVLHGWTKTSIPPPHVRPTANASSELPKEANRGSSEASTSRIRS